MADPTASDGNTEGTAMTSALTFGSPAFEAGEPVPTEFTCDGADASPPLAIDGMPDAAESLAVVVDDPDAPGGTFTHWLLWNLPAGTTTVPAGVPRSGTLPDLGGAVQGNNGFGSLGYRGPCPPTGDGPHTYRFTLHVLETTLSAAAGTVRSALDAELGDATVETARFTGIYER